MLGDRVHAVLTQNFQEFDRAPNKRSLRSGSEGYDHVRKGWAVRDDLTVYERS